MQPQTNIKFDKQSFYRIRRSIKNMSYTKSERKKDAGFATDLPDDVGIQLTHQCNLRCQHCFQWNDDGFFHHLSKPEIKSQLDIDVFRKIMRQTESVKSNLYLWGGEPLMYSQWDELVQVLEQDTRWTVVCTNGILIMHKLDSLLKISSSLTLLISLDGFEFENDLVRGQGVFNKVIQNIDLLLKLKEQGLFKGEISINCVISEAFVPRMFEFLEYFEKKGVNTVYFCFPWYISSHTAHRMDEFFAENFKLICHSTSSAASSWHAYSYHLNPNVIDSLFNQISLINSRKWQIRVRFQPALELDEIAGFINGDDVVGQKRKECLASSFRMNVLPSGAVTVCKMFPEFTVGNLNTDDIANLWHNESFTYCRKLISSGLMPVCSKCVLLYLHGGS